MTKRDFEFIADVLATAETWLASETCSARTPADALTFVRNEFRIRLRQTHPRFNAGRFDIAAAPIHHAELKAAIVRKLEQ